MGDASTVVTRSVGGFPHEVCVNKPLRKYLCSSCSMLLREPFQTLCGHRFCDPCIHGDAVGQTCPECNRKLEESDIVPDFGIRRDMKKLQARCPRECGWAGKFCEYQQHEENCFLPHRTSEIEFEPLEIMKATLDTDIWKYRNTETVPGLRTPLKVEVPNQTRTMDQNLISASNDGSLMWIIDDFPQYRAEAMGGKKTYLDSPPFMTSSKGYRLNARLYPNGNGYGKGTHLSLFVSLMQSPNDDSLEWPFRQKITVELLDQKTENQRHLTDHIYPDPNHPAFGKPRSSHNPAMGLVQFISLDQLNNPWHKYVLDDTIIIQISVDLFGL